MTQASATADSAASAHDEYPEDAIAVIGMSGRFPGAPSIEDLWSLLLDGREGVTRYSADHLADAGVPRSLYGRPEYIPVGSDLGGIEDFDADAFGMAAHEAAHLDPSHRLFLEACWHALERSGYGHGRGVDQVAVFAGTSQSGYLHENLADRFDALGGENPVAALQCAIGTAPDYLAMGTAYRLGLTGPAVTVQTACSTSLVAVHHAVAALQSGEADVALAGGATVHVPRGRGYLHIPDGPFSVDGHTRSYGSGASGAVFTQGVGVVVLKRLSDALADRDRISAVIRGSAINNDGSDKTGFTAPSVTGQARVIAEAHAIAGIEPRDVRYIEGHGTGTSLGDPIELAALRQVFGSSPAPWCQLGSIKSNIGHTEAAAGIAGFIKAVLAVESGTIPASLHCDETNNALPLQNSPLRICDTQARFAADRPRIAGVSSFGFGGTNCHVILQQPPTQAPSAHASGPRVLALSGASDRSAREMVDRLEAHIPQLASTPGGVADAAYTLAYGRKQLRHRGALVVDSATGDVLDRIEVSGQLTHAPAVVFAFPGGGSQYTGMLDDLYEEDREIARYVDGLAEKFAPLIGADVRSVCAPRGAGIAAAEADSVTLGLPALFVTSLALTKWLRTRGVRPDAVLGHSLGEYVAAVVCGALDVDDAIAVVAARAVALEQLGPGAMLRLALPLDDVQSLIKNRRGVEIASQDAPRSTVVSGPSDVIEAIAAELGSDVASLIPVAAPGHSSLVEPAIPAVRAVAASIQGRTPTVLGYSCTAGTPITAELMSDPQHWVRHMREPVLFEPTLRTVLDAASELPGLEQPGQSAPSLHKDGNGSRGVIVLTVGPGASTSAFARAARHPRLVATLTTLTADSSHGHHTALAELFSHGIDDLQLCESTEGRRRVALPDYPFDRRRNWIEPEATTSGSAGLLGEFGRSRGSDERSLGWFHSFWSRERLRPVGQGAAQAEVTPVWVVGDSPLARAVREFVSTSDRLLLDERAPVVFWAPAQRLGQAAGESLLSGDERHAVALSFRAASLEACTVAGHVAAIQQRGDAAALVYLSLASEAVDGADPGDPACLSLAAYARAMCIENPGMRARTVDVESLVDFHLLGEIVTEVSGADAPTYREYAWRAGIRHVRRMGRISPPQSPATSVLSRHDCVLIIGGLGRVSTAVAEGIARTGAHVVCTTRSVDRADARRRDLDDDLRDQITVQVLDPSDPVAIGQLLERLRAHHAGRVAVIYSAGVVGTDSFAALDELTVEHVDAQCNAKIDGALTLAHAIDRCEPTERPDTVILMSSIAAVVGGFGLSTYAAANRFLDALAQERSTTDHAVQWVSIQWDGWNVPSFVDDSTFTRHLMRNSFAVEEGTDALIAVLTEGGSSRGYSVPAVVALTPSDADYRFLHVEDEQRVTESTDSQEVNPRCERVAAARSDRPQANGGSIADELRTLWEHTLDVTITSPDVDFFELGGHSLLATRLLADVQRRYGVQLRLRDLLREPKLAQMVTRVSATAIAEEPASRADLPDTAVPKVHTQTGKPDAAALCDDNLTFGLTRVQHAYLMGRDSDYGTAAAACHSYLEFECGDLDLDRFDDAFTEVVRRHPMLRTVITAAGHRLVEIPATGYRTPQTDIRGADDPEQAAQKWRQPLVTRTLPPDRWPLVQPHALITDRGVRVGWSIDVLVCDASSFALFYAELGALYRREPLPPAPALTFRDYVTTMQSAADGDADAARRYWLERVDSLPAAPQIFGLADSASDVHNEAPVDSEFKRLTLELTPTQRHQLEAWARSRSTTLTAAVLTLYARMLARWSGDTHFSVMTTSFDRPDGYADVVGDFTELSVLELQVTDDRDSDLDLTTHTLFDDLDHRSYSGIDVLSERSRRSGRRFHLPVVFTSTLGSDLGGSLGWAGPLVFGRSQTPQVYLDHQVFEFGDTLVLQWDYLSPVISEDELSQAARELRRDIAELSPEDTSDVSEIAASVGSDVGPDGVVREAHAARERIAAVRELWARVLGREPEGIDDDASFIAAGGDSVLAVRLAGVLRRELGMTVAVGELVDGATPASLALAPRDDHPVGVAAVDLVRARDPHAPMDLLPLQQAYWVGQSGAWELSYDSAHFYVDYFDSQLDADRLRHALARLIVQQPMLRSVVDLDGRQRVIPVDDPQLQDTPLEVVDLREAPEPEIVAAIEATRNAWEIEGPDPQSWPGWEVR
ncbi:MAG: SDR family NAD(P)-dependent oxidoreductase, partial [Rhodococcus sp.]|nr:SDR family NAD(P)-dependent oxidoreductase [Rhodococcus sp. (in: high G+C Gram-positive bacteria)]